MNDPLAGWHSLVDCLKRGGLMRIGLYGELASAHVAKIRQEISSARIEINDHGIKRFCDDIIGSDHSHYKAIRSSGDFYSLGNLRDLLFHVQEHRHSILQIASELDVLGLAFCGFEDARVVRKSDAKRSNKNDQLDLVKWDLFEQQNPNSFAGIYQFWFRKIKW